MDLRSLCGLLLAALVVTLHADLGLAQSSTPRSIATQAFFDSLIAAVPASCEGKSFYTYDSFISAAESFSAFGTTGSDVTRKQEVAALLANIMHETGALCFVRETNPQSNYCDPSFTQWPCAANQQYFGRGPLQLSWNYNYGAAGQALQFDGLNNPDIVAQNPTIAFRTAVWFWMSNSNCHNAIVSGQGFGGTIRAINSGECNGGNQEQVNSRVNYYTNFCQQFGVDPGSNISC